MKDGPIMMTTGTTMRLMTNLCSAQSANGKRQAARLVVDPATSPPGCLSWEALGVWIVGLLGLAGRPGDDY